MFLALLHRVLGPARSNWCERRRGPPGAARDPDRGAGARTAGVAATGHSAGAPGTSPGRFSYGFLSVRERVAAAIAMQALDRIDPDDPANDERGFGEWLTKHHQSARAIAAGCVEPDRAPDAQPRARRLLARPGSVRLPAGAAARPGRRRYRLRGCHCRTSTTPRRARRFQSAGVEVHSSVRVETVVPSGDGELRVEVGGRPTVYADAVIVAVQHDRVPRLVLLSTGWRPGCVISAPRRSSIFTWCTTAGYSSCRSSPGLDSPVQWVFDRTDAAGLPTGRSTWPSSRCLAADEEVGDDRRGSCIERFVPALAELLPAARDANVEQFFVSREHAATFRAAPGARAHRPGPHTNVPGVLLAGRLHRHRLAGADDGGRGSQRPSRRPRGARAGCYEGGDEGPRAMTLAIRRTPWTGGGARPRRLPALRTDVAERMLVLAPLAIEARAVRAGAPWAHVQRIGMGPHRASRASSLTHDRPVGPVMIAGLLRRARSGARGPATSCSRPSCEAQPARPCVPIRRSSPVTCARRPST